MSETSYKPDYAVPPGWLLEEHLEAAKLSREEFAVLCGCSTDLLGEIIAGKAPVGQELAARFEMVLAMPAHIWLGMEAHFQALRQRHTLDDPPA